MIKIIPILLLLGLVACSNNAERNQDTLEKDKPTQRKLDSIYLSSRDHFGSSWFENICINERSIEKVYSKYTESGIDEFCYESPLPDTFDLNLLSTQLHAIIGEGMDPTNVTWFYNDTIVAAKKALDHNLFRFLEELINQDTVSKDCHSFNTDYYFSPKQIKTPEVPPPPIE